MKKLNNLKDLPNTKEVIINIPKIVKVMIISYAFVDEKGELRMIQENVDLKELEELEK